MWVLGEADVSLHLSICSWCLVCVLTTIIGDSVNHKNKFLCLSLVEGTKLKCLMSQDYSLNYHQLYCFVLPSQGKCTASFAPHDGANAPASGAKTTK